MQQQNTLRLAELAGVLSLATDLSMGYPLEQAIRSCILSVRLGEALKLNDAALQDVYYHALFRYLGCNADTFMLSTLVGDEFALRQDVAGR